MPFLVRAVVYDEALPGLLSVHFSDFGLTCKPSDTYPNVYWIARLDSNFEISTTMFDLNSIGGRSSFGTGQIKLANGDGGLDYLDNYNWDGRLLEVYYTPKEKPEFSDFVLLFAGTVEQVTFDSEVTIELRDPQLALDVPVQPAKFAGTGGLEGPETLKDTIKPLALGVCRQIEPVLLNSTHNVYVFSTGESGAVLSVKMQGIPMTFSANYASYSQLTAATIPQGFYATCLAESLVRVEAPLIGMLTLDVEGVRSGGVTLKRFGDLAAWLINYSTTLGSGILETGTVAAINAEAPETLGKYYNGQDASDLLTVLDDLCRSSLLSYGFNENGKIQFRKFQAPSGTADFVFDFEDIHEIAAENTDRRMKRCNVRWGRRHRPIEATESAGALSAEEKKELALEWRDAAHESASVALASLLAREEIVDSLFDNYADAVVEAQRRVSLFGPKRKALKVTVDLTPDLVVGQVVEIFYSTFGLSAGKKFIVLSLDRAADKQTHTMGLWG